MTRPMIPYNYSAKLDIWNEIYLSLLRKLEEIQK